MHNLVPIQITLQAANAAEAAQLVRDLAGTLSSMPPEQVPARTEVSTISPAQSPAPAQQQVAPQPGAYAPFATQQPAAAYPGTGQAFTAPPAVPMAPAQQQQQQQQQQPAPGAVPTSAPATYSIDQLAVAATQLMDAGKQSELMGLLQQFGIQALTMLQKEQYGSFATALRGLGARI